MKLFQKNEKTLVKSLIYGFVAGLYLSILFVSRIKDIHSGDGWISSQELSVFEYTVKVLQVSISISIGVFIIVLLYLYNKENND